MDNQNPTDEQEQWLQLYVDAKKDHPPPSPVSEPKEMIWFDFVQRPAPQVRSFVELSQPKEAPTRDQKPQGKRELSPAQIAKRQQWAGVLLEGATDRLSFRLAERLIRDWFGDGYNPQLEETAKRLEGIGFGPMLSNADNERIQERG